MTDKQKTAAALRELIVCALTQYGDIDRESAEAMLQDGTISVHIKTSDPALRQLWPSSAERVPVHVAASHIASICNGTRQTLFIPGTHRFPIGPAIAHAQDPEGVIYQIPITITGVSTTTFGALGWRDAFFTEAGSTVEQLRDDLWSIHPELNADSVLTVIAFTLDTEPGP